jgi:hypothetical protein
METVREEVMDLVDFIKRGVGVCIHVEGVGGKWVFDSELGDMLREILLKHRSEDATHKLYDAVVKVRVVLRHVECVGRSRS